MQIDAGWRLQVVAGCAEGLYLYAGVRSDHRAIGHRPAQPGRRSRHAFLGNAHQQAEAAPRMPAIGVAVVHVAAVAEDDDPVVLERPLLGVAAGPGDPGGLGRRVDDVAPRRRLHLAAGDEDSFSLESNGGPCPAVRVRRSGPVERRLRAVAEVEPDPRCTRRASHRRTEDDSPRVCSPRSTGTALRKRRADRCRAGPVGPVCRDRAGTVGVVEHNLVAAGDRSCGDQVVQRSRTVDRVRETRPRTVPPCNALAAPVEGVRDRLRSRARVHRADKVLELELGCCGAAEDEPARLHLQPRRLHVRVHARGGVPRANGRREHLVLQRERRVGTVVQGDGTRTGREAESTIPAGAVADCARGRECHDRR